MVWFVVGLVLLIGFVVLYKLMKHVDLPPSDESEWW